MQLDEFKVRSRAIWLDQGAKSTKYFCVLENRYYISKCRSNLLKADGKKL